MIYIVTALYCEAHFLIRQLKLTKNLKNRRFQEFYSETEQIRLTVTGVGEIAAAVAVSSVLTEYGAGEGDFLLNIGTCAHSTEKQGIFLCNRLTEQTTGKTFYPDALYRHPFREEGIVTGSVCRNQDRQPVSDGHGCLYDMEAAAIYQAGSCFLGPHQMIFLKTVSDCKTAGEVSPELVEQQMEAHQDEIISYIRQLGQMAAQSGQTECCFGSEEEYVAQLCRDLHCSQAMEASLRQYLRYLSLAESGLSTNGAGQLSEREGLLSAGAEQLSGRTGYAAVIQEMYRENRIPCKNRREGKLRFEELKGRLL